MLKLFRNEVRQELRRCPPTAQGVFAEADLANLPAPVRRYLQLCGWIGKPKMSNAALAIGDMKLRMDLDKGYMPVRSYQFNSVSRPARIAYLKASMFGMIPFAGRDKYQAGEGHMYIKLLNLVPIVNLKGTELDKSALVTLLAETFLAPSYALQPYIRWEQIDPNTARATLTDNGVSVSGVFYFKDSGELARFETNDRYLSQKDDSQKQTKWKVDILAHRRLHDINFPTDMSAWWFVDGSWKQYAQLRILDVRYDVKEVDAVMFQQ
jgi:hypothetical protein